MSDIVFDYGPEWRSFDEEDRIKKSRVGPSLTPLLHDYGVTTYISPSRDKKLAHLQKRVRIGDKKRLVDALHTLWETCRLYQIPKNICERAATYIHKICKSAAPSDRYLCYGSGDKKLQDFIEGLVVGLAHISGYPVAVDDEEMREKAYQALRFLYRKGISQTASHDKLVRSTIDMISDDPRVTSLAMKIYTLYRPRMQTMTPRGIAVTVTYMAYKLLDKYVIEKTITSKVGMSEATIRNGLKKIREGVLYTVYFRGMTLQYQWKPGDVTGLLMPSEVARRYGLEAIRSTVSVPCTLGKPIAVYITAGKVPKLCDTPLQ